MTSTRRLQPAVRWLWILALLAFGIAPSALFFAWVERNSSLPWVPQQLGWPWVYLTAAADSPWVASLWNMALFLGFGVLHSSLAQEPARRALRRLVPAQCVRASYLILSTGLPLLLIMGLWQHTGRLAWVAPLPQEQAYLLSGALFVSFLALAARIMSRFDPLEFLGLIQLFSTVREVEAMDHPEGRLIRDGLYSRVRHPMYLFTCAAFLVTPVMSWDRLLLSLTMVAYLRVAIPIEERKLVARFGEDYRRYQKEVPALFPLRPSSASVDRS